MAFTPSRHAASPVLVRLVTPPGGTVLTVCRLRHSPWARHRPRRRPRPRPIRGRRGRSPTLAHAPMAEQHLLDLAGIDVGAAGDDDILRAVLEREVALEVEETDVARVASRRAARGKRPRDRSSNPASRCRRGRGSRPPRRWAEGARPRRRRGPRRRRRGARPSRASRASADGRDRRCPASRAW